MPSSDKGLKSPTDKPSRFDFGPVADTYDKWYETAEGAMYDRLEKKAVSRYLPRDVHRMKLLEVGCGTGHWSRFFADRGFEVTGIDISENMIRVAQSKAIENASFQVADAHCLPFADGAFDVSAAITTLEFVRGPDLVLQEMVRCTRRPGGQLVVGVLNALAPLNRNRQRNPESLYSKARLFSPRQVTQLLELYGPTRVVTAGFAPRSKPLLWLSPLTDTINHLLHLPYGVFIAAKVIL